MFLLEFCLGTFLACCWSLFWLNSHGLFGEFLLFHHAMDRKGELTPSLLSYAHVARLLGWLLDALMIMYGLCYFITPFLPPVGHRFLFAAVLLVWPVISTTFSVFLSCVVSLHCSRSLSIPRDSAKMKLPLLACLLA